VQPGPAIPDEQGNWRSSLAYFGRQGMDVNKGFEVIASWIQKSPDRGRKARDSEREEEDPSDSGYPGGL